MKCYNHPDADAVSTCIGCGKALCKNCIEPSELGIIVCSETCNKRVNTNIEAIRLIRKKSLTQNKVSGIFCILAGLIFFAYGIYNLTDSRFLPLYIFMTALSVGFFYGGYMYIKIAKTE